MNCYHNLSKVNCDIWLCDKFHKNWRCAFHEMTTSVTNKWTNEPTNWRDDYNPLTLLCGSAVNGGYEKRCRARDWYRTRTSIVYNRIDRMLINRQLSNQPWLTVTVLLSTSTCVTQSPSSYALKAISYRQRLWLRLGVNVDDQLWLRLNPIPIPNCNPSANPSPCRNTNPNPNPNRPTTPLLTLTDPLTSK